MVWNPLEGFGMAKILIDPMLSKRVLILLYKEANEQFVLVFAVHSGKRILPTHLLLLIRMLSSFPDHFDIAPYVLAVNPSCLKDCKAGDCQI